MLGALLGAVGSIAGSILNKKSADDQMKEQRTYAQNAIQWKTADAVKAGLHPLAALGANTMSYSPVAIGDMAGPMSDMGQNVGRAIQATQNGTERASGALGSLQLERAGLENDLLRTQIASENRRLAAQIGPPMPTDGGLKMGGMTIKTDPETSNSQEFENRYGEPAEWIASPGIAWNDLKYNAKNMTLGQILKYIDKKTRVIPAYKPTSKRTNHQGKNSGGGGW